MLYISSVVLSVNPKVDAIPIVCVDVTLLGVVFDRNSLSALISLLFQTIFLSHGNKVEIAVIHPGEDGTADISVDGVGVAIKPCAVIYLLSILFQQPNQSCVHPCLHRSEDASSQHSP